MRATAHDSRQGRPFSSMERALWLLDQASPFTGVQILEVDGRLEAAPVEAALVALQARHPLLGMRIEGGPAPRFAPTDAAIPVRIVPRRGDESWTTLVDEEMARPFAPDAASLARVTLVAGDDRTDVLLTLHHVIADAISAGLAMRDLMATASALATGTHPPALAPLPLRPALTDLLGADGRGLRRFGHMNRFLWRHLATALWRRPRKLAVDAAAPPEARASRLVHRKLSRADTEALTGRSRAEGTTVHGALCAAMLLAAAADLDLPRPETLGCFSLVSLRGRLGEAADDVGLFVSQLATFHRVDVRCAFWDLAREVKRELARALEAGEHFVTLPLMGLFIPRGRDPGPRFARRFDGASPAAVGVTNIGRVPMPPAFGPFVVRNSHMCPALSVVAQLAVAVSTFAGQLTFNLIHAEPLLGHAHAERLAEDALGRLRAASRG